MFPPIPGGEEGRSRLLPWSVPFRFFLTAAVFHIAAWGLLLLTPEVVPYFRAGLGPVLAALHALTLGTLLMVLMGASLQLLPVATVQAVASVRLAVILWWVYTPGVAVLLAGMTTGNPGWLASGAVATLSGIALFALLLLLNLARAPWRQDSIWHGWVGWAALIVLLATGALLVWHYAGGGLAQWRAVALLHVVAGVYALMTVLAMGFGYLLIPLFALARQPGNAVRRGCLVLALLAVFVAGRGAFFETGERWLIAATALGLLAALIHVLAMARAVSQRLRPELGPWFALVALGWVMLPASLLVGLAALLDLGGPHLPTLFGALALAGWLLSFVLGVLSRIAPFLASVHALGPRGVPPLLATLTPLAALRVHRACHVVALAALIGAVAANAPLAVQISAGVGMIGGAAFLAFLLGVQRRMRAAQAGPPPAARTRRDPGRNAEHSARPPGAATRAGEANDES